MQSLKPVRQTTPVCLHSWRAILAYILERDTILRSIRTALVVGSVLALINHGQQMLSGHFSPEWVVPMLITYLVPFTVATYSQIQGKRQRDRLRMAALPHVEQGKS